MNMAPYVWPFAAIFACATSPAAIYYSRRLRLAPDITAGLRTLTSAWRDRSRSVDWYEIEELYCDARFESVTVGAPGLKINLPLETFTLQDRIDPVLHIIASAGLSRDPSNPRRYIETGSPRS